MVSRRFGALVAGVATAVMLCGCSRTGNIYQGGVLVDPAGVVQDVDYEFVVLPAVQGSPAASRTDYVDGAIVVTKVADVCFEKADVIVEVDGNDLKVEIVHPSQGTPCPAGESLVTTIKIAQPFDEIEIRSD